MKKKNPLDPHDALTNARPTRKKRRKSNEPEMLSRNVEITGVSTTVRLNAVHHKGTGPYVESQPWLELRGRTTADIHSPRVQDWTAPRTGSLIDSAKCTPTPTNLETEESMNGAALPPDEALNGTWTQPALKRA
jgi:hypothetical protein